MTVANFNYTGRARIKNEAITLNVIERNENYIRVELHLNTRKFSLPTGAKLVLDATGSKGGRLERREIRYAEKQACDFNTFGSDGSVAFRLKAVSTDPSKKGTLLAASAEIRPRDNFSPSEKDHFFVLEEEDLNGCPWRIDWDIESNPRLLIHRDLVTHFGNQRSPVLQGLVLPPMFRELLIGIISRNISRTSIDEDSFAGKILEFCSRRFERIIPEDPDFHSNEGINREWLEWAEDCAEEFCSKNWRGTTTLLGQMLEEAQ